LVQAVVVVLISAVNFVKVFVKVLPPCPVVDDLLCCIEWKYLRASGRKSQRETPVDAICPLFIDFVECFFGVLCCI
jgi:hypothetical protein